MNTENAPIVSTLADEGAAIIKLILLFIDKLPEIFSEIRELSENEEWEALQPKVHSLKGTGGNFGFLEITEVARSIEDSIRKRDAANIENLLQELESVFQRVAAGRASYPQ